MNTDRDTEKERTVCCGGPAPEETAACCVRDAEAKASGEAGCRCDESQDCC